MDKLKIMKLSDFIKNQKINIPIFMDKISAGFPSPASDYIENNLDLNEYLISHPAATFIVIQSGDLLIVDRSLTPKHNSIVIASIFGDLTVKQFKKKNGTMFLISTNSQYPNFEVKEEMECFIWGVVTYVIHSTIEK